MKVGTKVEIIGGECMPAEDGQFIGMRGIVIENPLEVRLIERMSPVRQGHGLITVDLGGPVSFVCCTTAVRPIEDDDRPATWDGIEQLTGWKRPAVPA